MNIARMSISAAPETSSRAGCGDVVRRHDQGGVPGTEAPPDESGFTLRWPVWSLLVRLCRHLWPPLCSADPPSTGGESGGWLSGEPWPRPGRRARVSSAAMRQRSRSCWAAWPLLWDRCTVRRSFSTSADSRDSLSAALTRSASSACMRSAVSLRSDACSSSSFRSRAAAARSSARSRSFSRSAADTASAAASSGELGDSEPVPMPASWLGLSRLWPIGPFSSATAWRRTRTSASRCASSANRLRAPAFSSNPVPAPLVIAAKPRADADGDAGGVARNRPADRDTAGADAVAATGEAPGTVKCDPFDQSELADLGDPEPLSLS